MPGRSWHDIEGNPREQMLRLTKSSRLGVQGNKAQSMNASQSNHTPLQSVGGQGPFDKCPSPWPGRSYLTSTEYTSKISGTPSVWLVHRTSKFELLSRQDRNLKRTPGVPTRSATFLPRGTPWNYGYGYSYGCNHSFSYDYDYGYS